MSGEGLHNTYPQPATGEPLLATKLSIPPAGSNRVYRPRLLDILNQVAGPPFVLVSAPAGYGKTTLLAQWAAQSEIPVAWVSLDAADNDPGRLAAYLAAAVDRVQPGLGRGVSHLLASPQPLPFQTLLAQWINDLAASARPFALVLDDFHVITSPQVLEGIHFLVERLPPGVRLVLATRLDPPFPLARFRLQDRLLEIRLQDLRFYADELADFFAGVSELALTAEDLQALQARTEGWAAGLQIAYLSLKNHPDPSAFIRDFGASHRHLLDYLVEEVLDRLPQEHRRFLLYTSVLDRFCPALCDAVMEGEGEAEAPQPKIESRALLAELERLNLFLIPLDDQRTWFRYHSLFADLLRMLLKQQPAALAARLHARASAWLEANDLVEESIGQAVASGDDERVAQLLETNVMRFLTRGQMVTLLGQIERLPENLFRRRPQLCVAQAWGLVFSGRLDTADARLQIALESLEAGDHRQDADEVVGDVAVMRALIADMRGDLPQAMRLAQQADRLLPVDRLMARSLIPYILSDGYLVTGDLSAAADQCEQIIGLGARSGNLWTMAVGLGILAYIYKIEGRLNAAGELYQKAIVLAAERGASTYATMGSLYSGWADLLREWDRLVEARAQAEAAIRMMTTWPNPTDLINENLILMRIRLSQDDQSGAIDALSAAELSAAQHSVFQSAHWNLAAGRVWLWLALGRLSEAQHWLDGLDAAVLESPSPSGEAVQIAAARVLLALDRPADAAVRLEQLAGRARRGGRNGRLVEILALRSLAESAAGRTSAAVEALQHSLVLAAPENYRRIYLDEGPRMAVLLRLACREMDEPAASHAQELLAGFGSLPDHVPAKSDQTGLIEPLTDRELEVLHLLCSGITNQEIAGRLVISLNTVKRHNNSIFAKLGVNSRAQAMVQARRLGLVPDF